MPNDKKIPRFEARNSGTVRIEGRKAEPYPVHLVYVDKDTKDRIRNRFLADFNQDLPGMFQLAEIIAQHLNDKDFVLP